MTRVKRGVLSLKRRRKILKQTKGFRWGRKNKEALAREALLHGMRRMFRGRKEKKRTMRALWNVRINAAVRPEGMTYGRFIAALKKKNIRVDRKILSELAVADPEVFKKIVAFVKT